jgi:hypothetical protein
VSIGQQHFEQTPLALSASDHARSFEALGACSVENMINTGKRSKTLRFVTAGRRPSVQLNDLRSHFFTGK